VVGMPAVENVTPITPEPRSAAAGRRIAFPAVYLAHRPTGRWLLPFDHAAARRPSLCTGRLIRPSDTPTGGLPAASSYLTEGLWRATKIPH